MTDDPYTPHKPEPMEVMIACETLIQAGFAAEANAVLAQVIFTPAELRDFTKKLVARDGR